jgi:hypothetical protein
MAGLKGTISGCTSRSGWLGFAVFLSDEDLITVVVPGVRSFMLVVVLLIVVLIVTTVCIHMEGLWAIQQWTARLVLTSQLRLGLIVLLTLLLHVGEILCYGSAFLVADRFLSIGALESTRAIGFLDYFYFSAETFTAVGYGDILVTGDLRLIASIEPLNGLTLISWSGAFTFLAMQKYWNERPG